MVRRGVFISLSIAALVAIILLASACTTTNDDGDLQQADASEPAIDRASASMDVPRPTAPLEPATGPDVRELRVGETVFTLHDEGDNCLAVEISHPGLQETVERTCFDDWNTLRLTNSCGWLAENAEGSHGCDVELPQILYGIVTKPSHKYVCVGRFSLDGTGSVVGARVLPMEDDGLVFTVAEPGESYHAHFLNGGGKRIGDPPLDAPSDPIYTMCEAQVAAERDGRIEAVHNIDLIVTFDSELLEEDVTVVFHSGLDLARASSSNADADGSLVVKVRTSPSVSQPTIEIEIISAPMLGD